jgi:small subunit ribosomal protein S4
MVSEAKHARTAKRPRRNMSNFAKQLLEKQRVRFSYGIPERQLRRYVEEAGRASILGIDPGTRMVEQLEMRLDNVVYRLGIAPSRRAARQLVSHGHIVVNGTRMTIPSRQLSEGDMIVVRDRTRTLPLMERIKTGVEGAQSPVWLSFNVQKYEGKVTARPTPENTEMPGSVSAILEYYSR